MLGVKERMTRRQRTWGCLFSVTESSKNNRMKSVWQFCSFLFGYNGSDLLRSLDSYGLPLKFIIKDDTR